jgi:hypothetical protein
MRVPFPYSRRHRAGSVRATFLAGLVSLLVFASAVLAQAQPAVTHDTLVLVEFPTAACASLWPILKPKLEQSKTPELLGGSVVWMTRDEFHESMEFNLIYQIKLRGDCRMDASSDSQDTPGRPLGWVFMVNEHIQPFVYVDCDRLVQMLHRDLRNKPTSERKRILARAISRIVVHEMTHIVTQSALHATGGLQKAHVTPYDLLAYHTE